MSSKWQAFGQLSHSFASISKFCWQSLRRQNIIYAFAHIYKKTTKIIIPCQEFPLIFHNESWRVCKSWPHKKKLHRMNFSFTRKVEEIWVCLDARVFLNRSLSAPLVQSSQSAVDQLRWCRKEGSCLQTGTGWTAGAHSQSVRRRERGRDEHGSTKNNGANWFSEEAVASAHRQPGCFQGVFLRYRKKGLKKLWGRRRGHFAAVSGGALKGPWKCREVAYALVR